MFSKKIEKDFDEFLKKKTHYAYKRNIKTHYAYKMVFLYLLSCQKFGNLAI